MIRTVLAICLSLAVASCTKPAADSCEARAEAMLDLSFAAFDQGVDGWRSLDGSLACSDYADDVLAQYRSGHGPGLGPANASLLMWHEAQVLAVQGDSARSIGLMHQAAYLGEPQWQQLYREGSIAFLKGELAQLQTARDRLSRLPRDESLIVADGKAVAWPPNLDVLDGLISCFGKPYSVAYACRRPPVTAYIGTSASPP